MAVTPARTASASPLAAETSGSSSDEWRPLVALVGPRSDSHGGVATTLRLLLNSRLTEEFDLVMVSTYRDGPAATKAFAAAGGLARLIKLCAGGRLALVHVHASSGSSLARKSLAVAVARFARVPVVLHVHGGPGFHVGRSNKRPLERLQRRTLRWALESSDTVVALTPGWERSLVSRGRLRRSCVIPNAPDYIAPARTRKTKPDLNPSPEYVVLYLGHLYRDKGVYDLIDAFAMLHSQRTDLRLVLAGEGPEAQGLRSRVDRLGLGSAVELPGWVGPEEKSDLFQRAACFVLPSHHEGLPLALLEAMHARVPIVVTAVGGVPDVAADGEHALLVPPKDVQALATALTRVLDDSELAERLAGAAHERALADYTTDALTERVRAVYRQVLASP